MRLVLAMLVACSAPAKPAPSNTTPPPPPPAPGPQEFVAVSCADGDQACALTQINGFRLKACTCHDKPCAEANMKKYRQWVGTMLHWTITFEGAVQRQLDKFTECTMDAMYPDRVKPAS